MNALTLKRTLLMVACIVALMLLLSVSGCSSEGEAKEVIDSLREYANFKQGTWLCTKTNCYYVYDPEKGDPSQGVLADTSFENLPDDWRCPVCNRGKEVFEKL